MKKILVTGITGFVGSHMADYILKNKKTISFMELRDTIYLDWTK